MNREENPIEGTINSVTYDEAMKMTEEWQKKINPATDSPYPKSYTFDVIDFLEILNQRKVRFIRMYPGVKEDGSVTLLAVGADETNTDIIQVDSDASGIYDFATPCPTTCGKSPLNHFIVDRE